MQGTKKNWKSLKYLERFWELWGFIPFYHILSYSIIFYHILSYSIIFYPQIWYTIVDTAWFLISLTAVSGFACTSLRLHSVRCPGSICSNRPSYVVIRSMTHIQSEHMWTHVNTEDDQMVSQRHNVTTSQLPEFQRVEDLGWLKVCTACHISTRPIDPSIPISHDASARCLGAALERLGREGLQQFLYGHGFVWKCWVNKIFPMK